MNTRQTRLILILAAMSAAPAFAQTSATATATTTPTATEQSTDRNVQQQKRIEQGLKSGQLTTREAGKLEHEETQVERLESHADANGKVSPAEARRIAQAQHRVSEDIHQDKTNARTGNPEAASTERLEKDVHRDVKQQQRIDAGVESGALTTREAGKLERGQAADTRIEAKAAANGHVGAAEQARIAHRENVQSQKIYNKKHNEATRGGR